MSTLNEKAKMGQAEAVYAWGGEVMPHLDCTYVSLSECQAIVNEIWFAERNSDPPTVKDGRGHPWARGGRRAVHLPRWARYRYAIFHEVAHSLTISDCGTEFLSDDACHHGPYYARVLTNIMINHGKADPDLVYALAKKHGVVIKEMP